MKAAGLKTIFGEALERPAGPARAAYLDAACGGDAALRSQVEGMLRDHDRLGGFLASVPGGPASGSLAGLAETLGVLPRVLLRDAEPEAVSGPLVQPSSPECPGRGGDHDRLARYQFFGEIARGGMGAVLKARDADLGRELAVKVLLEAHRDDPELVRRFVEEAQVGGQLQHPGIVPIYELGVDAARRPYFAMKLVRGRTLAALLHDRPDPAHERRRFLAICEQVCQTIAYAHARGVIHRDLKPANVMVGAFGEVQVVDWGLAKVLAQGGVADEERPRAAPAADVAVATIRSGSADARSVAGSVRGTPAYMPPEQARGEADGLDERADVFALGGLLCEILTGRPPFAGTPAEALARARAGDLADTFARLDGCGAEPDLIDLARRCLAPDRAHRPREAGPVARALSDHLASADERARAAERDAAIQRARAAGERRARQLAVALAAVVLAAAVVVGVVLVRVERERRARFQAMAALEQAERARAEQSLAEERRRRAQDARLAEVALAADVKGNLLIQRALAAPPAEAAGWAEILAAAAASAERLAEATDDDHVHARATELLKALGDAESLMRERARAATPARDGSGGRDSRRPDAADRAGGGRSGVPIGGRPRPTTPEDTNMPRIPGCTRCVVVLTMALAAPRAASPALARPPADRPDAVAACTGRLETIHRALAAYEQEHRRWPDHLSDLVPKYLPDPSALRDPGDPGEGGLGSDQAKADPKFRVSYSYERCVDVSNGLACPLGRFPVPDLPGAMWGSWRLVNGHQETFFGDQVPVVRCYFHRPPEGEREDGSDLVLNLTPSGRVYRSDYRWDKHPDSLAYLLRTLDRDLTQGPGHMARRYQMFRLKEHLDDCDGLDPALGLVMVSVADGLIRIRAELPDGQREACYLAACLRRRAGDYDGAHEALAACEVHAGPPWSPIVEAQLRARIFHDQKHWDREIATYEWLLRERPDVRPYMEGLAAAHEAAGHRDEAERWRRRYDPGSRLVGRPAPDFRVPLRSGGSITLDEARRDRKALLLNFWFRGCGPCRQEFPQLQALHDDGARAGLRVLAVDHGDTPAAIDEFVAAGPYTLPIGVGRNDDGTDNPIFAAYHVAEYPTSYLIDAAGRILWRGVGLGPELKAGLARALDDAGVK